MKFSWNKVILPFFSSQVVCIIYIITLFWQFKYIVTKVYFYIFVLQKHNMRNGTNLQILVP